jgi:hypothetical protein
LHLHQRGQGPPQQGVHGQAAACLLRLRTISLAGGARHGRAGATTEAVQARVGRPTRELAAAVGGLPVSRCPCVCVGQGGGGGAQAQQAQGETSARWRRGASHDRWSPQKNRGSYGYPHWSWMLILDLYFLLLDLQISFGGLNLEVIAGDALRHLIISFIQTSGTGRSEQREQSSSCQKSKLAK